MSTVENEKGATHVKEVSNLTRKGQAPVALGENKRTSVKRKTSLIRKKEVQDTPTKRKKKTKKSSDGETKRDKVHRQGKERMSTVENETGVTHVKQESNLTKKGQAPVTLSENERASVKRKTSLIRKKEVQDTLQKRKKKMKKSSDGENNRDKVLEEGSAICKEKKTFNWRNYQWQNAICLMNEKIVNVLSHSVHNCVLESEEESALQDNPRYRVSYKKMKSDVVQLPPLDVPSDWILESSHIESSDDILEDSNVSEGSISPQPQEMSSGWIVETSTHECKNSTLQETDKIFVQESISTNLVHANKSKVS